MQGFARWIAAVALATGLAAGPAAWAQTAAATAGPFGSAQVADLEQADAALFVIEEYLDGDNSLEEISRHYADVVSYYDLGPQSLETVLTDKAAYLRRWPRRVFAADLGTLVVANIDEDIHAVTLEVDFEVTNARSSVAGRSLIEIVVRKTEGGHRIIAEGGQVLSRR